MFLVGFVMVFGYLGVYAAGVMFSKDRVVAELVAAVEAGDRAVVEDRLDLPALRAFLKTDIGKKSRALYEGDMIIPLGPTPDKVEEIVEYYVQPEKIDLLFFLRPIAFPGAKPADFVHGTSFHGPFAFTVTVGYPRAEDGSQPTFSESMTAVTFLFRVDGWTWRASEMYVPLFLVPQTIETDLKIEHALSRRAR